MDGDAANLKLMANPKITIVFDTETGKVSVDGPINDKLLCFGLLELAKNAINEHARGAASELLLAKFENVPNLGNLRQIKP